MRRTVILLVFIASIAAGLLWLWMQTAPLSAIVRGGDGPPTVVLLHGYGGRAEEWLQFVPVFQFPGNARMIFPRAPLRHADGSRGWWWLNLEGNIPDGEAFADYSKQHPRGIQVASRLVREYLENVRQPIILGGFSQGAMTAGEVAFDSNQELSGLILLGGTTVNEEEWALGFAARRQMPIFIAHGRDDDVLSFERMEKFQARLVAAGLQVTWLPFDGGHEIPEEVVQGINRFIRDAVQLQSSAGSN